MLYTSFSKLLHNLVYQYAFNISSIFTPENQGFQFGAMEHFHDRLCTKSCKKVEQKTF